MFVLRMNAYITPIYVCGKNVESFLSCCESNEITANSSLISRIFKSVSPYTP